MVAANDLASERRSPRVSVLVVHHRDPELAERAVQSVRRSSLLPKDEVEILVWENGPDAASPTLRSAADVRLFASPRNLGFGPANDRLAREARGDFLLFLNHDALLAPECLHRLLAPFDQAEPPVAVAPLIRSFDGSIQEVGSSLGPAAEGWQLLRGKPLPAGLGSLRLGAHYASAACLLVDRRHFRAVGGFDNRFAPAYYEDTDLCQRLGRRGRVVVEPRAVAFHLERGGCRGRAELGAERQMRRNRSVFLSRWSESLVGRRPVGAGTALQTALAPDGEPLVLWLLPEFLKPDQSGGHARIWREMLTLTAAGFRLAVWSEHLGDSDHYGRLLAAEGIAWFGYHDPDPWRVGPPRSGGWASVQSLLALGIWDAVVASSAELAGRFQDVIAERAPDVPFVVDNMVLAYLQGHRAEVVGAALTPGLVVSKDWELGVYRRAAAVVTSSHLEHRLLERELPGTEIVPFDVGAYEPVPTNGAQRNGALVFLGSFHHPPNVDAVGWWVDHVGPRIEALAGHPIPLRVLGTAADTVLDRLSGSPHLDVVGWVADLGVELGRARVFAAPLRYGAGTKDKISVAMRYGIPTVTTPTGAESMPDDLRRALVVEADAVGLARAVVELMTVDGCWERRARSTRDSARHAWSRQQETQAGFARWFRRLVGRPTRESGR